MSDREFETIMRRLVARRERTTFPAPVEGRDNHATAERHAEHGAARH